MSDRVNRRDLIIETASRLFIEKGYTATTVRQIADRVGVTEAALYYHFKDGKRALLQAVVEEHTPRMSIALEGCQDAENLGEFVRRFGERLQATFERGEIERFRWVIAEFPRFNDEERAVLHAAHMASQHELAEALRPFLPDPTGGPAIAWMILCAAFGYGQLFINLGLEEASSFAGDDLVETLATALQSAYGGSSSEI